MWLPQKVIAEVDEVAIIGYIHQGLTKTWNENKKAGELRALTGYYWVEKGGRRRYRHGFKTYSMAASDAWYELVQHSQAPMPMKMPTRQPAKLRIVRAA